MVDDGMIKGIIAGLTGALVQNVYAYTAKHFSLTDTLYVDVSRSVLFNSNYQGTLATIVSLIGHFIIDSFWGILFAFLIVNTSSRFFCLKGVVFAGGIWFLVRVVGTKIIGISVLSRNNPAVALFFFIGAVLFGLTISFVLKLLNVFNEKI